MGRGPRPPTYRDLSGVPLATDPTRARTGGGPLAVFRLRGSRTRATDDHLKVDMIGHHKKGENNVKTVETMCHLPPAPPCAGGRRRPVTR